VKFLGRQVRASAVYANLLSLPNRLKLRTAISAEHSLPG
jgi:hypothetical protein